MTIKTFLFLLLALTIVSCLDKKEKSIDSYFINLARTGHFNGNVLISKGDTVTYQQSFGFSNFEKNEPLSHEHLFGLGSIYKEFPAVAIMQLEEKGLLSINDSLSMHLQTLPTWSNTIRIKHLLNYSSGLPVVDWQFYFQSESGVNQDKILKDLEDMAALEAKPGTKYIYSNYNPLLLIQIIEKVAQSNFSNYLKDEIFIPHDIKGIELENKFPFESKKKFALPFDENLEQDDIKYELPTIYASTTGLFHWIKQLNSFKIITKESLKKLSTKFNDEDSNQTALGELNWNDDEIQYCEHHGSSGNYECLISREKDVSIVLLTNQKHSNLFEIKSEVLKLMN